jgi:ABC-type uncharacterized transport system involved in gliding motility auxiliary subunit
MTTFRSRLKYLFLLGPFLLVMGISAGVVASAWGSVPLGLMISGGVIIGLWLIYLTQAGDPRSPSFWRRRSTQASTNALIATIAVLTILGLGNFLAVRHAVRIDLTESQIFTLAPQTQSLLRTLPQPVKAWIFSSQPNPQDRELLESYRRQNSKFSFEVVDPQNHPGIVQEFGVKSDGDVYLELLPSRRRHFVQTLNSQERLTESKLTSGLVQLNSDRRSKVYFLQGHGERSLEPGKGAISQAVKALTDKNFDSQPLNLAQEGGKIPGDASLVAIVGPSRSLLEGEVTALKDYLTNGGNLLVAIDPNTTSGLDSLLNAWGIQLDQRVAIDASGSGKLVGLGPAEPLVTQYADHPITQDFRNGISFYPLARPLEIVTVPDVQATPFLLTDVKSWAESDIKQNPLQFNPEIDRPGPLPLGVALTRKVTAKPPEARSSPSPSPTASASPAASPRPTTSPTPAASPAASPSPTTSPTASPADSATPPLTESRLVVLGNSNFATDNLFDKQLNGDVLLNSISWLSQQNQQPFSIRPKDTKNRRITLTEQQGYILVLIALGAFPLLGASTALGVWWKRR